MSSSAKPAGKKNPKRKAKVMGQVDIRRVPVKQLKLAAYNPRVKLQPGMPAWEAIKKSLETFSLVEPLVFNERTGNLVGGHQRLEIMVATLNVGEVDVSVVNLSLADEKLLNLALNKVQGEWEDSALMDLLAELQSDINVDQTVSGFDDGEIDKLLDTARNSESVRSGSSDTDYQIVVQCNDKKHQTSLVRRFAKEGLACSTLSRWSRGSQSLGVHTELDVKA